MAQAELHRIVVGREAMGCRFEVVFNAGEVAEATELAIAVLDLVDEIEDRISVYRASSEFSCINAAAGAWVRVSADTLALLGLARELHAKTAGGFDIAAGSLVEAWGFLHRQGRTPEPHTLASALAAAGTQHVEMDEATSSVRLVGAGSALNPGGIGKGWAIDRGMSYLIGAGVPSVLVHGGQSSVRALGTQGPSRPDRSGWTVGLRHPLRPGRRLATITLRDKALGTSGSGTQFFIERGKRLGHILDPRTGHPAEGVLSATVIAESAAEADALATALYVLGPDGASTVAPSQGTTGAILVLPRHDSGLRIILANLDESTVVIEREPGLVIERSP